jgi:O-antigen ligase
MDWLLCKQVWATIMSLRYSITWFVIFLIFSVVSWEFLDQKYTLERWWSKIIGWLLRGSLFWWAVAFFIPRLLEFAWYNQYNYEWDMNIAPPAAYYAQYNQWYVRNQFLFERPISWGFFLVAFWPLFFALAIKRRWWKAFVFGGGLYWLAVLSTFSRAAWIAWIVQTWILLLIEYRKDLKKAFFYWWIPIILIFGGVAYLGRDQIIHRQFSNTGHIVNIKIALEKIQNHPWFGEWPGTAWPASHHLWEGKEYNPENQFLQIWIEYGIFGFIAWMILYIRFMWIGLVALRKSFLEKETKQQKYLGYVLFSLSLGIFWLGICWLVLHSFVDRMIVYPFMAMFGLIYGQYKKAMF